MNRNGEHNVKWNKPDSRIQIPHDFSHAWNLGLRNPKGQEHNSWTIRGKQRTKRKKREGLGGKYNWSTLYAYKSDIMKPI
jgi:hypothetical protein